MTLRALGKLPPRHDPRTLRLARYLPEELPVPPACDWTPFATSAWPLYQNDQIGCCALASGAHLVQGWSAADGHERVIAEPDVIAAYSTVAGYKPGHPETDRGSRMLDVLKWWRRAGYAGHAIGAYAAVEATKTAHVRAAIALLGGAYLGLALPVAAQDRSWSFTPSRYDANTTPGSWGGHAVAALGYGEAGALIVTWGELRWMSWDFLTAYADEAWALLGADFVGPDGRAPNHFDSAALRVDLARISSTPLA